VLETVKVGQVDVDRCPRCQGLWFDRRELKRVLEGFSEGGPLPLSVGTEHIEGHDETAATCPRCDLPLARSETIAVAGLHWDTCDKCGGAWLDGGELTTIASDPDAAAATGFFSDS